MFKKNIQTIEFFVPFSIVLLPFRCYVRKVNSSSEQLFYVYAQNEELRKKSEEKLQQPSREKIIITVYLLLFLTPAFLLSLSQLACPSLHIKIRRDVVNKSKHTLFSFFIFALLRLENS
jgi:type III secretory pathway component EscR